METTHDGDAVPFAPRSALTRDMLGWLAREPRTYAETMEAWRSTCPRRSIWEDALANGLVRVEGNGAVVLTARGRAALAAR